MARPRGTRLATTWAVSQKPRPSPRVVRIGRAANDNAMPLPLIGRLLLVGLAVALVLGIAYDWWRP